MRPREIAQICRNLDSSRGQAMPIDWTPLREALGVDGPDHSGLTTALALVRLAAELGDMLEDVESALRVCDGEPTTEEELEMERRFTAAAHALDWRRDPPGRKRLLWLYGEALLPSRLADEETDGVPPELCCEIDTLRRHGIDCRRLGEVQA